LSFDIASIFRFKELITSWGSLEKKKKRR